MQVLKITPLAGGERIASAEECGGMTVAEVVRRAGGPCWVELVEMTEEEFKSVPAGIEALVFFRGAGDRR
jgi:hypothetical protein